MMKYAITLFTTLMLVISATAQTKPKTPTKQEPVAESTGNVVTNGSFENTAMKTLKNFGQLAELSTGWFTATQAAGDVFSEGVKSTRVAVPTNELGTQTPHEGSCYAGFVAYTKDVKRPRTYLQTKFNANLVKDQMYCVRMQVSLAENSKYAVNNLGMLVSDRKIDQPNTGVIAIEPQVKMRNNMVVKTMDGWETLCTTYVGTGQEEYLIIGCFGLDEKVVAEKAKRPAGSTGIQQQFAYYFVDNIEFIPIDAPSECFCGAAEDRQPDVIYSKSLGIPEDSKPAELFAATGVYFGYLSNNIESMFEEDLNRLLGLLKSNPMSKVEIIGHCDNEEVKEGAVNARYSAMGQQRADKIKEWFVAQGIQANRITTSSKENTEPASTMPTPLSKAQNRRVVFILK
ncbi:MAG: OmpA family protein [Flavobacteriales bacterium]|nr:OmpA family protein [Flavobacteriales bacterium]